jgi:hypothetical protein
LAGHHHFRYFFALKNRNELGELADVDPVESRSVLRQLRRGFVFNGDDYDFVAFAARRFKSEKRRG